MNCVPKALVFDFSDRKPERERPSGTAPATVFIKSSPFASTSLLVWCFTGFTKAKGEIKLLSSCAIESRSVRWLFSVPDSLVVEYKNRAKSRILSKNRFYFSLKSTLLLQSGSRTKSTAILRTNSLLLKLSSSIPGLNSLFSFPLFAELGRALGSRVARSPLLTRVSDSGCY